MLRVATFNVQNLFDRPKILDLDSNEETSRLLRLLDDLQLELGKAVYDQPAINDLLQKLKGYIEVRVDSGKFFKGRSKSIVGASGKADWMGAIDLKRNRFSDKQRINTGKLLQNLDSDICCLIEAEGRQAVSDFMQEYVTQARRLKRNMLIDSPIDPRGIDIALAWKSAELGRIHSNAYDQVKVGDRFRSIWSRDCLEVELRLSDGTKLHLLGNHFKSKMGGDPPDAQEKRMWQAQRAREILTTRYDLQRENVILLGDLNDVPTSPSISHLRATPGLHDVLDLAGIPESDRWTYYFAGAPVPQRTTQIDYIFVSEALRAKVSNVRIHREGMSAVAEGKIQGMTPLDGITSWRNAASDHAAITVDLNGLEL